ncbi:MAG: eukaryotic-like serine/threonine-protein kinase [Nocardioidaceae bacterium]|nr:eukaryotic-like serine/threonine-protein kinase [Nocardioidaceae bacterium]
MTRSDVLRAGDMLNGYRLLEDFRVVGAGLSEWSFAERGGRIFFIKRFLSPTYPEADAPGSERIKAKKRARCATFEAHHRGIQAAMAPLTTYGGNLIATLDFFRVGAKYYKVTERVDVAGLQTPDVAALDFPAQLVLLKTVAHSLKILHDLHIVHSDLKPSNVLIKRTELGYTTKLIDFDSSYIVGNPPPPDEIVGTMNYYSPELVRYVQGSAAPAELTEASDIFALGLIYAEYLTGAMPSFDAAHHEAAIAVLHGERLKIGASRAPGPVIDLVERMLAADPAARPRVAEVHSTLMGLRGGAAATKGRAPVPIRTPVVTRDGATAARAAGSPTEGTRRAPSSAPSVLRGRGVRIAGRTPAAGSPGPAPVTPPAPTAPARPRPMTSEPSEPSGARGRALLGRLLGKLDDRRSR